ncbi:MAG: ABC transporter permease [Alphaproteobacteria bacterium]|nr:ABC transporter permease [Alphaproteobacteria bacterium]
MGGGEKPVGAAMNPWGIFSTTVAWFILLFLMLPSFVVVPMSFGGKFEMMFPPTTFDTILYERFFSTGNWIATTITSFKVAIGATVLALLLGVPAAYGIVRGTYPGKKIVALFLLSPILVPVIVLALGMYLYLASFKATGTDFGLIIAHGVLTTPFVIVTCMAGLRHIDPNLETAATIMGASVMQTFFKVTLPLLKSAMFAGGLFAFLMSFDEVVVAFFITEASTMTLPVKMYSSIKWEISPILAAISSLLTFLSLVVCLIGAAAQKKS